MHNNSKGRITIERLQKVKNDPAFILDGAVLVRFTNQGQNLVWIDEQEVLQPGESWVEGDLSGPGIDHEYKISFLTNPSPPTANKPVIYAGNFLNIRVFKRKDHAGK